MSRRWSRPLPGHALLWLFMLLAWVEWAAAAAPIFENRTPVGFSPEDSTTQADFVLGAEVVVRADLNQAATSDYPVIGHFHNLERSVALSTDDVDGLRVDIAVSQDGAIHMAWIDQEQPASMSTPIYHVSYARSEDHGKTFSDPVSVSGSLRFDLLTLNVAGTSGAFSTLDLEVDSRGNPRVVYAFNFSADGHTARFHDNPDNIWFNYSEDGGASWLPANHALVVNDTSTVGNTEGRHTAFPCLRIDQRDNIYIAYARGASAGSGSDDIMLARMDRSSTPFAVESVGSLGTAGSTGGVRLTADGTRQTGPSLAVGSGDVLHVIYFDDAADQIEHKTLVGDAWSRVGATGWNQGAAGALVDAFDNESTNPALETDARFYFPTVVVDQQSSPNRIYALYKYGDASYETVFFNSYVYDNATGGGSGWSSAQAAPVWSTATSAVFANGANKYNIELEWTVTEPVAAVVDDRLADRGDLHIAFSAGYSGSGEQEIYYGYYNGSSWTLPELVADDDAGTADGVAAADVFLAAPCLATYAESDNVYLAFVAGTGEGLGVDGLSDVDQHPYFKVLGRALSSTDISLPVGGFQYDLEYTPTNPQNLTAEIPDNLIYVHVADNGDGSGLGATGHRLTDGFLAGDWERIGTTLADADKHFEGRINEDTSTTNEWGDDDDKVGLLVKLNVLGSDSATNVQTITASSATGPSVAVASDPSGSFVSVGDFFVLGADIDIVDANTAPVVTLQEPDGTDDEASTEYAIHYDLTDTDDTMASGGLEAALYFSADSSLASVQDVRIFGTLIVDQQDNSTVFSSGTDDFAQGRSQTYTWDDPPAALEARLFANIHKVPSGRYFIYLVADDKKNPPVFTRSPGAITLLHKPIIEFVAPATLDTVDTGVRSGEKANPYDLSFLVRDFDRQGGTQVQLFYSAYSGLSSVSPMGSYPNLRFTLGKSVSGVRGVAIPHADTLTSVSTEFAWDLTDSVAIPVDTGVDSQIVAEGAYYLYAVATDSTSTVVGQSQSTLVVKHSPSLTLYEPAKDTYRQINTGSQPVFTVQWQKGRGDADFDDDAVIDLYFTTDNPATINYEDYPDSLLLDGDTRILVTGLSEDGDGAGDMYAWDLRDPPYDVPRDGVKVWIYARISDAHGNVAVAAGGAVTMTHDPHITLMSSELSNYANFLQKDVLRVTWDDYLVDDGVGTDNAYIRLYASTNANLSTLAALEAAVDGTNTVLINSSNGLLSGEITTIREDSVDFYDWNTKLFGQSLTSYHVYAAIGKDPTFVDNTATTLDRSSSMLAIGGAGTEPNVSLSPTDLLVAVGDTLTMDVMVQYSSPINFVQVVLKLGDDSFSVVDSTSPFTDLEGVFPGTSPIENTYLSSAKQLRFSKSTFLGQQVGTTTEPARLARFQLVSTASLAAAPAVAFSTGETGTVLGVVGRSDPLAQGELGFSLSDPQLTRVTRGKIRAYVELEGRTLGSGQHNSLLDVHLRVPGSTMDITDSLLFAANDDYLTTSDTLEVTSATDGLLTLLSVPPGRYVLTVKDTSHISGRSDTFSVRNGETVEINANAGAEIGFYGSDLRGDRTPLLGGTQSGWQLVAGDVSEDNEIDEDDVNLIVAAWGTDTGKPSFAQADINNDVAVGAADLTVTASNFGNSEGFGAPPVYKTVAAGNNQAAVVELAPLLPAHQVPRPGETLDVAVRVRQVDDLAGYELELDFDPTGLRLLPAGVIAGDVFQMNPRGAVQQSRCRGGLLSLLGARYGKEWSARGEVTLAILQFQVLNETGLASLHTRQAMVLNSRYAKAHPALGAGLGELLLPQRPGLEQNYPNPFNPSTTIAFSLPRSQDVRLEIYDVLGQRIRTLAAGPMDAGWHALGWNGRDGAGQAVGAGVYLYLLRAGEFHQQRKMILVK